MEGGPFTLAAIPDEAFSGELMQRRLETAGPHEHVWIVPLGIEVAEADLERGEAATNLFRLRFAGGVTCWRCGLLWDQAYGVPCSGNRD